MKRGCGKGCLIVLGIFLFIVAVVCVVAFVAGRRYLAVTPRVDTASFITDRTAVIARVDLTAPGELTKALAKVPGIPRMILEMALPYECSLLVDVDAERKVRQLTGVASMRRFGPQLLSMFGSPGSVQTVGKFRWTTPGIVSERGALLIRGEEDINPEALDVARERWQAAPAENIMLEGGHLLEMFVDNRRGQGFLACAEATAELEETVREMAEDSSNAQPPPKALPPPKPELQRIFDATELSGLFYRARTARLTADAEGANSFRVSLTIECPDEAAARSVEFAVLTVRDLLFRKLLESGVTLEGDPALDGTRVRADFTLSGVEKALGEAIGKVQEVQINTIHEHNMKRLKEAQERSRAKGDAK